MKPILDRGFLTVRLLDAALSLKLDQPDKPFKVIFKELIDDAQELIDLTD